MPKIKLYTKTGDPYSDMVKNLLMYHRVECEFVEVSRNLERQKELFEISGQTNTPVLKVDDKVYTGFDREKIKEILGIKGN
ncbi:MAG: glutaredoxin family protein [Candidatus Woesearchaeota archaeon]